MNNRMHYLDACRAILMLLGIPYHAALVYDVERNWLITSPSLSPSLTFLAHFLHSFRLDAFFIVAGYFSLILVRRRGEGAWFRTRLTRLGIPLVTSALVISPLQALLLEWGRAPAEEWGLLAHRACVRLGTVGAHWVMHLWFLVDLLVLSALCAIAFRYRNHRLAQKLTERLAEFGSQTGVAGLAGALAILGILRLGATGSSHLLGTHRLSYFGIVNVHRLVEHAPMFWLGALLGARPEILARLVRKPSVTLAATCLVPPTVVAIAKSFGLPGLIFAELLTPAAALSMTMLLFSASHAWLNRPSRLVSMLVDMCFTIYLVHHPLVLVLGLALVAVPLTPVVEFAAIVIVAAVSSAAVHQVIARSPLLIYLFNGTSRRVAAPPPAISAKPPLR